MMTGALCDDVDHWYVVCGLVLLMLAAVVGVLAAIIMWRRRRRRERSASLCSAIRNGGGGGGPKSKSLSSQPGSLVSIASTSSSRSTAPLIQVCMVGGDVTRSAVTSSFLSVATARGRRPLALDRSAPNATLMTSLTTVSNAAEDCSLHSLVNGDSISPINIQ